MSIAAQKRYIDIRTDRVRDNILLQDAEPLPKRLRTWKEFKNIFDNKNNYEFSFSGHSIIVNVRYAYDHFLNNTYFEPRSHLNGTLHNILHEPLLLIKDSNTLTFYKPFKNQNDILHVVSFQAHQIDTGKYLFKTIYEASDLGKVKKIIKATDENTIYFKYC